MVVVGWYVRTPRALVRGKGQGTPPPTLGMGTGIRTGPRPVEDGSLPGRELP